ncbi:MAG: hypothetical protein NVSMB56_11650 [Pyrinomonadaceae bacterium]
MKKTQNKRSKEYDFSHAAIGKYAQRDPSVTKMRITLYLDADVLEYFKKRAAHPNAAPYQTQINAELRRVMSENKNESVDEKMKLLADERFINALAERVRMQLGKEKKTRRRAA